MALSDEKREIIDRGIADGLSPKDIAASAGVSITTVYNYKKQEVDEPRGMAPPNMETTGTGKTKRISKKSRPITEETAGQLCGGIFAIAAMMDGPEWFLSPEERDALGGPLADSLRILPAPIAEGVNLYSAPVMFVTTLSTIMYAKGKRRAMRGNRPPLRSVPPPVPTVNVPVQSQAATQPSSSANPNVSIPSSSASPNSGISEIQTVIAAAAAAKGGLTGIDEHDDSQSAFD